MIKFLLLVLAMVVIAESLLNTDDIKSDLPVKLNSPDYTMTRNY